MTEEQPPSPLASPEPWDLVSAEYTSEVVPIFETFAKEALRLANVTRGKHVVDVACGPGTLSLLAAREGATVAALDFSPRMIAHLEARVVREGLHGIEATVGDGTELPYPDASFDAGFSLFGLMFFPDRGRGFRELARVLRRGARAVVSSWTSLDRIPFLGTTFQTLGELVPSPTPPPKHLPLVDPDECRSEMTAGGFTDVSVHTLAGTIEAPSTAAFVNSMERTNAPIVLLRRKIGDDAWGDVRAKLLERLSAQFGAGPQTVSMPANIIVGTR